MAFILQWFVLKVIKVAIILPLNEKKIFREHLKENTQKKPRQPKTS